MAFPTGWGRKCALTVPAAQISGTSHTDFPVLLTLANLPSEMFDSDGSYPALNGGGDIRFSSDSAGTTQLACEIVSFVTDANPANGSAEIWVKIPTLATNAGSGTTFYVWYNKSGETQPAVTDTYGRNAVWVDYACVYHGDDTTDSTGGGNTLTGSGGVLAGQTGQIGDCFSFDGTNDVYTVSGFYPVTGSNSRAVTALIKSSSAIDETICGWGDNTTPSGARWEFSVDGDSNDALRTSVNSGFEIATSDVTDGTWKHVGQVFVGTVITDIVHYVNGSDDGTASSTSISVNTATNQPLRLGAGYSAVAGGSVISYWNGQIDEFRIRDANVSRLDANWMATENNSQLGIAAFVSHGTPESVGGGTNYDETIAQAVTSSASFVETYTAPAYSETLSQSVTSSASFVETYEFGANYQETIGQTVASAASFAETYTAPSYNETIAVSVTSAAGFVEVWQVVYTETIAQAVTSTASFVEAFASGADYYETMLQSVASTAAFAETYGAPAYSELLASSVTASAAFADSFSTPAALPTLVELTAVSLPGYTAASLHGYSAR